MKIKCHKCDKEYKNKRSLIKKYNNFMICFICYHEDTKQKPVGATKNDAINYF